MLQPRRDPAFAHSPADSTLGRPVRRFLRHPWGDEKLFHRNDTAQQLVVSPPDNAHSTAADLGGQSISARDQVAFCGHRRSL
jgi:hypothetical protein